jgi:aspartyl-tRNA(Asn)/glutamyl-tRNA(Gln) amidotransferase subunit A
MMLHADPFASIGLAAFASLLRRGATTAEAVTRAALERIDALGPKLDAFTVIDGERALDAARAVDGLLRAGVDLGPLAGLPVVVKDLFSVQGLPTTAGSRLDVGDLVPPEGTFVRALKRGGAVVVAKARTSEFAMGGFNLTHPLPWNPCDARVKRMTGGSSHGSAVAVAAGLCALSVGSDTGGSVRQPAAFTGIVGYKASAARWPLDGVFPMCPAMDSIGLFARTVADAAWVFGAMEGRAPPPPATLDGLRLAIPRNHFFDDCEREVREAFEDAVSRLRTAGAHISDIEVPEAAEIDKVFATMVPADVIAFLGRERFLAHRAVIDPVARQRAEAALELPAIDYIRMSARQRELVRTIGARMGTCDAWLTPTVPTLPAACAEFDAVDKVAAWNRRNTHYTRPANLFGQCGLSLPLPEGARALPMGLQVLCRDGADARLLSIGQTLEAILGTAAPREMAAFLG